MATRERTENMYSSIKRKQEIYEEKVQKLMIWILSFVNKSHAEYENFVNDAQRNKIMSELFFRSANLLSSWWHIFFILQHFLIMICVTSNSNFGMKRKLCKTNFRIDILKVNRDIEGFFSTKKKSIWKSEKLLKINLNIQQFSAWMRKQD